MGPVWTVQKWVVYTPFCPMAPAGIVEGHARGHKVFHADPVAPPCQADTRRLRRNRRLAVNSRPLPSRIRAVVRRSMTMAAPPPIPVRSRHRSLARRPGRERQNPASDFATVHDGSLAHVVRPSIHTAACTTAALNVLTSAIAKQDVPAHAAKHRRSPPLACPSSVKFAKRLSSMAADVPDQRGSEA